MTENQRILELLKQYLESDPNPEVQKELLNLINRKDSEENIKSAIQQLIESGNLEEIPQPIDLQSRIDAILQVDITPEQPKLRTFNWSWVRYAAAIILFIAAAAYWFSWNASITKSDNNYNQNKLANTTEVEPGTEGAVLTLADGTQIVLDSLEDGVITTISGAELKLTDGQLQYQTSSSTSLESESTSTGVLYHTLTTPRGRQFSLTLPDGTMVWLNAASSIRFPLVFPENERKVEVSGEVYFEVVKKMRGGKTKSDSEPVPFFVNTRNQQIEVLGTHFNVNAYEDDEDERTTLLEGSVKVSPQPHIHTDDISATRPVILKPGQQTVISGQNGLTKPVFVSTDEVMAWKNGLFQFDRTNIHQIMKQVARWYNVDVVYKNNLSQMDFSGTVARSENISEVLKMLELTGAIRFRLEGRTVVVFK